MKIVLVFLAAAIAAANADCCGPPFGGHMICDDGSETSTCCGVGPCNIFCCNCDGGCRISHTNEECMAACDSKEKSCESGCILGGIVDPFTSQCISACVREQGSCHGNCDTKFPPTSPPTRPVSLKSSSHVLALSRFGSMDSNEDKQVDFAEFTRYIRAGVPGAKIIRALFNCVDEDGDGRISLKEFDESTEIKLNETACLSD